MTAFTIRNDFHNSSARVRVADGAQLSQSQIRRVKNTLCGCQGCTCGGSLSERGRQDCDIEAGGYGRDGLIVRIYSKQPAAV